MPELSEMRAKVIEGAINIEWTLCLIICQHYFGKVPKGFLYQVLCDEYFSYALKRRIIKKIVPKISTQLVQKIDRVGTIRNYFAHCNQILLEETEPGSREFKERVVDPRNLDKALDFEKLYEEFIQLRPEIEPELLKILNSLVAEIGPPNSAIA